MRDYTRGIKAEKRDRKREKARHGMRMSGKSLKSTVIPTIAKKAGGSGDIHYLTYADGETNAQYCVCGAVVYEYNLVTIRKHLVTCQGCKGAM